MVGADFITRCKLLNFLNNARNVIRTLKWNFHTEFHDLHFSILFLNRKRFRKTILIFFSRINIIGLKLYQLKFFSSLF